MTLGAILLGTLAAGIGSVWIAAWLSFGVVARYTQHMLSLAAGALMATAFMHLLPEAFEAGIDAGRLFAVLLVGLVFFFLLDKAELWHHGHEHHHGDGGEPGAATAGEGAAAPAQHARQGASHSHADADAHAHAHHRHDHAHAHAHAHERHAHLPAGDPPVPAIGGAVPLTRSAGKWAILAGDSVHCFGDGVLIASAFIADIRLGVVASLAVLAHEVPHHVGDLVVVREGSDNRRAALVKVSLAGAVTAIGGLAGYWLVDRLVEFLPYFLVIASSSFVYVALADLIPQLQKRLGARQTIAQIAWLLAGIAIVSAVAALAQGDAHTHSHAH